VSANATSVGLDVHARSVVACGLDGRTGELFERRLTPDHGDIESWIRSLPGPVAVTYEAGPTGFGLARYLTGQGIECLVAAPSRLQRPSGDRVKTDLRDARHLARLLHLDQIVAVAVPGVEQEAARDLVRARDAARRLLIEAAWHHRPPYRTERELRRRQDAASPAARDRGQRANRRLHARWAAFDARLKLPVVANTAIARELAGLVLVVGRARRLTFFPRRPDTPWVVTAALRAEPANAL